MLNIILDYEQIIKRKFLSIISFGWTTLKMRVFALETQWKKKKETKVCRSHAVILRHSGELLKRVPVSAIKCV